MKRSAHQHHHHPAPSLESLLTKLKAKGLKTTAPRKAILQGLLNDHGPFTAEEIHRRITKKVCDLVTVYRTLASLEDAGILNRCEFGDGSARYELGHSDETHHHHIICNHCKRVEIIDEPALEEIDRFAQKRGFSDISHKLEFFGTCNQCK